MCKKCANFIPRFLGHFWGSKQGVYFAFARSPLGYTGFECVSKKRSKNVKNECFNNYKVSGVAATFFNFEDFAKSLLFAVFLCFWRCQIWHTPIFFTLFDHFWGLVTALVVKKGSKIVKKGGIPLFLVIFDHFWPFFGVLPRFSSNFGVNFYD
jgi:hypothetical protein